MPRIKCNKCSKAETVLRAGFIQGKQRFFCKECNYHFTLHHVSRKSNGKKKNHQTTIVDIAKAIGVSASRALHDHEDISVQTRDTIKALAEKMDYQRNLLAQSFASWQTNTIRLDHPQPGDYLLRHHVMSGESFTPKTKTIRGNLIIRGSTVRKG